MAIVSLSENAETPWLNSNIDHPLYTMYILLKCGGQTFLAIYIYYLNLLITNNKYTISWEQDGKTNYTLGS